MQTAVDRWQAERRSLEIALVGTRLVRRTTAALVALHNLLQVRKAVQETAIAFALDT
jgi:hypothetical protein